MQVNRVWSKKLFGDLSVDTELRPGINLLVGRNGSGKTSVLNIINWLVGANIPMLATNRFDELGVDIIARDGKPLRIVAIQEDQQLTIHGSSGPLQYAPISVKLAMHPRELPEEPQSMMALRKSYSILKPEPDEIQLWNLLHLQRRPLTILLDRTVAVEDDDFQSIDMDPRFRTNRQLARASDPIANVEAIGRTKYAQYQSQLIRLNDELKAKLITSSFETGASSKRKTLLTLEQVSAVEKKLLNRMSAWSNEAASTVGVSSYFSRFRNIVASLHKSKKSAASLEVINQFFADEMTRIARLSDAFEQFEGASNSVYEPLKRFLDAINQLLADTQKELFFDDLTNNLRFRTLNARTDAPKSVGLLSSGERQLLILLTYVAFPPPKTDIFIIDEPELSLHLKWQHELLGHIEDLMGSETQMIIATHSPEIVGRHVERCVQL